MSAGPLAPVAAPATGAARRSRLRTFASGVLRQTLLDPVREGRLRDEGWPDGLRSVGAGRLRRLRRRRPAGGALGAAAPLGRAEHRGRQRPRPAHRCGLAAGGHAVLRHRGAAAGRGPRAVVAGRPRHRVRARADGGLGAPVPVLQRWLGEPAAGGGGDARRRRPGAAPPPAPVDLVGVPAAVVAGRRRPRRGGGRDALRPDLRLRLRPRHPPADRCDARLPRPARRHRRGGGRRGDHRARHRRRDPRGPAATRARAAFAVLGVLVALRLLQLGRQLAGRDPVSQGWNLLLPALLVVAGIGVAGGCCWRRRGAAARCPWSGTWATSWARSASPSRSR